MSQPKRGPEVYELLAKIKSLSPERVTKLEDFVDSLRSHERGSTELARAANRLSEAAFAKWMEAGLLRPSVRRRHHERRRA